jgi:hypothetical protein
MTSDRTISQVRAILNKLDRSIDEAREKRRQGPAPHSTNGNGAPHFAAPAPPPPTPAPIAPAPSPAPARTQTPGASAFGRAQPLRAQPAATNLLRFNTN